MTLNLNLGTQDFDTLLKLFHDFDINIDHYIDLIIIINQTQVAKIQSFVRIQATMYKESKCMAA